MHLIRCVCALVLSLCVTSLAAQNLGTGLYEFGSFDSRGFDSINLGNLNTHFEISTTKKAGRGINANFSLAYDGLVWAPSYSNGSAYWQPTPNFGFHGELAGTQAGFITYSQTTYVCQEDTNGSILANFVYHDGSGRNHSFNYSETSCPFVSPVIAGDGSTSDGSGLTYIPVYEQSTLSGYVRTASGSTINALYYEYNDNASTTFLLLGSIIDANGNTITNNSNNTFTDTLGVTAMTIGGSGNPYSPITLTYPVALQSDNASTATASLFYQSYTVQTNFQCSNISEYGATSINLPDHLTLADGSTYSFTYEPTPGFSGSVTGRLASVTLPTGGTISYSYTSGCNGSGIDADGSVGNLTRATSDGTRTYNRAPINANASSTTVQDEKGNQSLYNFTISAGLFYETQREIYQGATGGSNLFSQFTCYNGATPPCDGASVTLPIGQTIAMASYNNGSQTTVTNVYDSSGMLTSSTQAQAGSVLELTTNTYNSLEEPLTSTTTDGSGTVVASSSYGYDATAPTATSGIPSHTAATGTRGNQTSSSVSTGSGNLTTTTTYYDTGMPIATTTPNGTTQYTYDSTQTFVTTTTLPTPSSGVPLATSASYDPQSGVQISATGMNSGETTQVTQYNRLLRPTILSLSNGGSINYNYEGTNQTGVIQPMGNGQNVDTETLIDGYGRMSRVALYNGQPSNPWYQVDYCYDASGLLQFQSSSYQANGFATPKQCSGLGTSYTHDTLGRLVSSTNSDGTTSHQYQNRAVETTSVNGVQKITQYDLLGRVTGICEISSNSSMPGSGSPTACGMDIAGTGFVTNYAYNLASHTITITQGAQSRSFQTDATGRTIYTSEPERGVTNYSYTYNSYSYGFPSGSGTGLQVTRVRPRANQPNPNITTSTVTQYDSLGRVVNISYNDGLTAAKTFIYDSSCCWSNGTNATNLKGRLSVIGAETSDSDHTGALLSYDIMGNVVNLWQCAPSTCPTSNAQISRPLSFSYDLAGNLISESDTASGTITYGRSPVGEVTSITNRTYTDPTNTPSLASNIVNGPNGPISYSLGNGLNAFRRYDTLGRLNGTYACAGPAAFECQGATQVYGSEDVAQGNRVLNTADTVLNQITNYGYDEFNRLTSTSIWNGQTTFSYSYDRYGNRWAQNAPQGGPAPNWTFNTANNQVVGFSYDAAGNLTSDGIHNYTYDAEGNLLQVDGGATAQYVYDALNRRVRAQTSGLTNEYIYDYAGRRISTWDPSTNTSVEGRIYWNGRQIAFRAQNGTTYFNHQDSTGTERMRTNYTGAVASTYISLPWGDAYSPNVSDSSGDQDNLHYAQLDHDSESNTDHAQFRQYSNMQGRWMSPDPYNGSYHPGNPQSFNRYSYVMNRPLSRVDPTGMDEMACDDPEYCDAGGGGGGGDGDDGDPGEGDPGDPYGQPVQQTVTVTAIPVVQQTVTVTAPPPDPVAPIDISAILNFMNPNIPINNGAPNNGRTCIANCGKPAPPSDPKSAFSGSVSFPVLPGVLVSFPVAITNNATCVGIGGGFGSPGFGINGGIVHTSSSNIVNVLSGASVSVGATSGWWGLQWSHNSAGIAAGNLMGTPGVSLTVSYSWCF
jgi:RHS repeat-associated protein